MGWNSWKWGFKDLRGIFAIMLGWNILSPTLIYVQTVIPSLEVALLPHQGYFFVIHLGSENTTVKGEKDWLTYLQRSPPHCDRHGDISEFFGELQLQATVLEGKYLNITNTKFRAAIIVEIEIKQDALASEPNHLALSLTESILKCSVKKCHHPWNHYRISFFCSILTACRAVKILFQMLFSMCCYTGHVKVHPKLMLLWEDFLLFSRGLL